jgi:hypothetical protein
VPLRDHFHPPLDNELSWEPFHSAWVNTMVRHLNEGLLPERYRAQPQARLGDPDVFEVRVEDRRRGSRLVAAVEVVSPANKDRPANRRAFAVKCASYLQQNVSVLIVDIVSERHEDLYAELLELLEQPSDRGWAGEPPLYAVACRTAREREGWRMDTWAEVLRLGADLPTLPLWLASDLAVPLELEASYEEALRVLRLT